MKKIYLSLLSIVFAINFSYAQTNTFPTSGNAGIGTTSPIDPFQISGSSAVNKAEMSITNTDAGGNTWRIGDAIGATAGIFTIYNVNNSVLPFVINGNTGNIGVGIAYPLNKLHVYSASSADGISIDGNTNPAMVLRSSGVIKGYAPGIVTTNGAFFSGSSVGDMIFRSESNKILFGINGNASTMAISGNNVGIGTTNPDQLLTVKGIIPSQEV